jgi:hypothetical protein
MLVLVAVSVVELNYQQFVSATYIDAVVFCAFTYTRSETLNWIHYTICQYNFRMMIIKEIKNITEFTLASYKNEESNLCLLLDVVVMISNANGTLISVVVDNNF